jgi:putative membrane protein
VAIWAAGGAGLALAIVLLLRTGLPQVLHLLDTAGWRLLLLAPIHLVPLAIDAAGWRWLLRGVRAPSRAYLTWVAVVREAIAGLLPVARMGGEVVGARLLTRRGVPMAVAGASVVVEVTVWIVAHLLFAGVGLVLLLGHTAGTETSVHVGIGLLSGVVVIALFVIVQQRWGLFEPLERILSAIAGRDVLRIIGDPGRLDHGIRALYRQGGALGACMAWQLASLFAGALELWITFRFLGHPASVSDAIVVESLTTAVQSAMFFVPAGLGTQEGSFVLFGTAVGLPPDLALALSLARRVRQLLLGVPALIVWYWTERRYVSLSALPSSRPGSRERDR